MMTWTVAALLALGSAGQRMLGMFGIGALLERRPRLRALGDLLPVAVVSALILQLGLISGGSLTIDARVAGLAAAAVLVWRRASLVVVVLAAAAVTAGFRAAGFG
jgi:hypothetical protein